MNPSPGRSRRAGGPTPTQPDGGHIGARAGLYRPRVPPGCPGGPCEVFNEIFARLASNRDRALVAFYVSTGARASELLSVSQAASTRAASW